MSKIQLKKELVVMEKDQLVELILDAYAARKETKEYLEFFLNPDVDKLREKYEIRISKELNRVRRGGYAKARISFIKNQLKEFASFQPGFEAQLEILFYTLSYAMACEIHMHFSETLSRGIASLMLQIVDVADINLQVAPTLERLQSLLDDPNAGARYFRRYLADTLASRIAQLHVPQ